MAAPAITILIVMTATASPCVITVLIIIIAAFLPSVIIVIIRRLIKIGVVFLYRCFARTKLLSSAQLIKIIIISIIIISLETDVVIAIEAIIVPIYITLRRYATESIIIINLLILIFLPLFLGVPAYLFRLLLPLRRLFYNWQLSITV